MSFRAYDLLRLVTDFGSSMTLNKVANEGSYDPTTSEITGESTTDYTFTGYFFNYDVGLVMKEGFIVRGKRRCVMSAIEISVEPDQDDQIVSGGVTYNVNSVQTIFSDGSPICHICELLE